MPGKFQDAKALAATAQRASFSSTSPLRCRLLGAANAWPDNGERGNLSHQPFVGSPHQKQYVRPIDKLFLGRDPILYRGIKFIVKLYSLSERQTLSQFWYLFNKIVVQVNVK